MFEGRIWQGDARGGGIHFKTVQAALTDSCKKIVYNIKIFFYPADLTKLLPPPIMKKTVLPVLTWPLDIY